MLVSSRHFYPQLAIFVILQEFHRPMVKPDLSMVHQLSHYALTIQICAIFGKIFLPFRGMISAVIGHKVRCRKKMSQYLTECLLSQELTKTKGALPNQDRLRKLLCFWGRVLKRNGRCPFSIGSYRCVTDIDTKFSVLLQMIKNIL